MLDSRWKIALIDWLIVSSVLERSVVVLSELVSGLVWWEYGELRTMDAQVALEGDATDVLE